MIWVNSSFNESCGESELLVTSRTDNATEVEINAKIEYKQGNPKLGVCRVTADVMMSIRE